MSLILLRLRMRPKTPRRRGAKRSGALQAALAAETWGGPLPWRP